MDSLPYVKFEFTYADLARRLGLTESKAKEWSNEIKELCLEKLSEGVNGWNIEVEFVDSFPDEPNKQLFIKLGYRIVIEDNK